MYVHEIVFMSKISPLFWIASFFISLFLLLFWSHEALGFIDLVGQLTIWILSIFLIQFILYLCILIIKGIIEFFLNANRW